MDKITDADTYFLVYVLVQADTQSSTSTDTITDTDADVVVFYSRNIMMACVTTDSVTDMVSSGLLLSWVDKYCAFQSWSTTCAIFWACLTLCLRPEIDEDQGRKDTQVPRSWVLLRISQDTTQASWCSLAESSCEGRMSFQSSLFRTPDYCIFWTNPETERSFDSHLVRMKRFVAKFQRQTKWPTKILFQSCPAGGQIDWALTAGLCGLPYACCNCIILVLWLIYVIAYLRFCDLQ